MRKVKLTFGEDRLLCKTRTIDEALEKALRSCLASFESAGN